jgi:hypothetical protein
MGDFGCSIFRISPLADLPLLRLDRADEVFEADALRDFARLTPVD